MEVPRAIQLKEFSIPLKRLDVESVEDCSSPLCSEVGNCQPANPDIKLKPFSIRLERLDVESVEHCSSPSFPLCNEVGNCYTANPEIKLKPFSIRVERLEMTNTDRKILNSSSDEPDSLCFSNKSHHQRSQGNSKLSKDFCLDRLVWAEWDSEYGPAYVIDHSDCGHEPAHKTKSWVFWFGDHLVSKIPLKKTRPFVDTFTEMYRPPRTQKEQTAVQEVLEILAQMADQKMDDFDELVIWADEGFKGLDPQNSAVLMQLLRKYLDPFRTNKHEVFLKDFLQPGYLKATDLCISCYSTEELTASGHPFFSGGHCISCSNRLKEMIFAIGDDGKNVCCIVCGHTGVLVVCENKGCPKSYCKRCLVSLVGEENIKMMSVSPWICFFCTNAVCAVPLRANWEEKLFKLMNDNPDGIVFSDFIDKRPINVLSLFDGISTGKVILDMLGIEVNKYYSSEIDENAIIVSKMNHPGKIVYLGDVTGITTQTLQGLEKIDLILAGSPCNDFSSVNPNRRDIDVPGSSCNLFYNFASICEEVRRMNPNVFYLFENVASMNNRNKEKLNYTLQREPARIDAKYFSAQIRTRYYWSNIPGVHELADIWNSEPDKNCEKHMLEDYITKNVGRQATVKKIRTVTCQKESLNQDKDGLKPVLMHGKPDILWITELESIFGYPKNYTDTGHLSYNSRLKLLGKAWSIQVVKTILQPLRSFFKTT